MKKPIALLLCLASLVSAFAGCGAKSSEEAYVPTGDALLQADEELPTEAAVAEEETLVLAYYPNRSMNPLIAMNFSNRVLFSLMYQGLFAYNSKNQTVPILCSRYRVSSDSTVYTFYVDEKATFSDGSRVTIGDVIASYDAAKQSDYYKGRFTHIVEYKLREDGGLTFYLPLLLDIPIVKASQVAEEHPLGTGPYEFHAGEDGADLTRVANWWCGDTQLSTRAKTIQVIEATSQTQLRDEFEFGDLNLACADPLLDSYGEYRCDFELWEVDNGVMVYLACNTLWSDYFKDSDVLRKALTYAIDRETLNEDNYRGMGQPSTLVTSPRSPYYNAELAERFAYDPLKFLDAIGRFTLPKNDKGEVQKLKLLVNADDSARLRMARQIASHLTELGIPTGVLEYGTSGAVTYRHVLNDFLSFEIFGVTIPTGLLLFFAACCLVVWLFMRSKTGIAMSAAGANPRFAAATGINVDRMRIIGTMLSTMLAAVGIIVYGQSYGFMQLYQAPRQMGFLAASAILIGGATTSRAKISNVVIGTFLFQGVLTLGMPVANALVPQSTISETLRILISNGIILYALTKSGGANRG